MYEDNRCAAAFQAQEISLNYHCKCEQWVHFASGSFFNFNGTAGEAQSMCLQFSLDHSPPRLAAPVRLVS